MDKPLKLIQVTRTYWNENHGTYDTGIILALSDGRYLRHGQDGYVTPFDEVHPTPADFVHIEFKDTYEQEQALKFAIANQIGMVCHPNHLDKTRMLIDKLDKLMSERPTRKEETPNDPA